MQHFFDLQGDFGLKPFLILGKGPSAEKFEEGDFRGHRIFALNEAGVITNYALFWHIIDIDVVLRLSRQNKFKNAGYIVMPYFPHVEQKPDKFRPLPHWIDKITDLRNASMQGRLLWYNLSSAPQFVIDNKNSNIRVVQAQYFSAEAAFELLAKVGVKRIDTLGIDGGCARAQDFEHIPSTNPHGSYDKQFANIERIVRDYGITWRKL